MPFRPLFLLLVLASLSLNIAGCSSLAKRFVDTQPRVALEASSFDDPNAIVKGKPVLYQPTLVSSDEKVDPDLVRYAPLIVQGFQPVADPTEARAYDYWSDGIGMPRLARDDDRVIIDTNQPTIFCRTEKARVRGRTLKQLVYVAWYPRRPVGSIEKGNVDGNVLRITLDRAGRPALFEYTQTCGCFHGTFAATHMEQWARDHTDFDIDGDNDGLVYALEKQEEGVERWIVRGLIDVTNNGRPVMYLSAGRHFCEAIRFVDDTENLSTVSRVTYQLREYESLTHLAREGGGEGSMFNEQGLVHGGERKREEFVLSDMNHPGWPRHLDKMLVHWSQEPWTDPELLSRHLRLPAELTQGDALLPQVEILSSVIPASAHTPDDLDQGLQDRFSNGLPFAVLVTNRYCLSCEQVKTKVVPMSEVQTALGRWNYILLDTFVPEDAAIATRHRVEVTPTLLLFDSHGHKLFESSEIESPDQIVTLLNGHLPLSRAEAGTLGPG